MNIVVAFALGLVFGIGLLISGMSNPEKVLGFLDISGTWDPTLGLVMGGALAVGYICFRTAEKRQYTLLNTPSQLPCIGPVDRPLILGSALFGIGWGLAGICPGPGFVLLGSGQTKGLVFIAALLVGMLIFQFYQRARHRLAPPSPP